MVYVKSVYPRHDISIYQNYTIQIKTAQAQSDKGAEFKKYPGYEADCIVKALRIKQEGFYSDT